MSLKANYFKLGLFVLGAVVAGVVVLVVIGSGRWFQPKLTIETYFNESVQGLDIGSKLKYRGVAIGEVKSIGFTYNWYQQDKPVVERVRYVLVEAQIQPKLLGGRAGAGNLSEQKSADLEIEKGLRVRLAPQGITGTSYLEIDYVEPAPDVLPIDWVPGNIYIPSAPSTVTALINSASEIMDRLHKLDIETTLANFNKLLVTTNARIEAVDAKVISQRAERVLAKLETSLDNLATKKLSDEGVALLAELRATNAELRKTVASPVLQKLPDDAAAALARVRAILDDPHVPKTLAHLSQTLGRIDRILTGGEADLTVTFENLRQITDNLRDLTEDSKRYPARSDLRRAAESAGAHPMKPSSSPTRSHGARVLTLVAMVAVAATIAACSMSRPALLKRTFLLEPAAPPMASVQKLATVKVGLVNVAAPYRGKAFVYRSDELKFEADFYSEFFVAPAAMLSESTARALAAANVFRRTIPPGAADAGDYVLDGFASSCIPRCPR